MIGSAIRELAATRTVPLVCAAFVESIIQVWDLSTQQKTGEFTARFAFGMKNLAVHPGGESLVTGFSKANGIIASYTMPGGEPIWHRDHMRYPERIRFGSSGGYLLCALDGRRVERIDARTGDKTGVLQDTICYLEGPDGRVFTASRSASGYLLHNSHLQRAVMPLPFTTTAGTVSSMGFSGITKGVTFAIFCDSMPKLENRATFGT
jgi:hypothetical protein